MRLIAAILILLTGLAAASSAEAARRVALIIGNGTYQGTAALANPARDATAIAEVLKPLNFEVILATDVDRRDAIAAIDKFSQAINGAEVALLFFAGHGIQIGGQNFLLPTDVSVESERALRYSAVDIQEVVAEMERRAEVAIAILDACRDNPFVGLLGGGTRSAAVARGLGPMRLSGRGALIAYAAASGDVAADGSGGHSPFTDALLKEIAAPNVEVGLMFRRVARRVIDETNGNQRPELLVRLVDEVYLNPTEGTSIVATVVAPAEPDAQPTDQPVVVADATRQATLPDGGERFFGNRAVHPPPWTESLAVPQPSGWRSLAPAPVAEAANDTYGSAQMLPLAAEIDAQILPRGDADWYMVEVPTAGELHVFADAVPAELDLYARIWDANHVVVVDWQGSARPGGALDARFALPAPGRYWIEVSDGYNDQESSAPFKLAIDFAAADDPFEPNNALGTAFPLPLDSEHLSTIYPRGDADWFKVWVPEPGLLSVSATKVPEALDIAMRIWNLDGQVVKDWAVPPRPGGDTLLEAEISEPGVYLIETGDSYNDMATVAPFALGIAFGPVADTGEPNNIFGDAIIVPPTGDRQLAIFPRGDNDWLGLDVDHPGELRMTLTGSPQNLDVYMRVWNSDKQVLKDWFGPPRVGGDVDDFADLPAPGRYFIEIVDGNNDQASRDLMNLALTFTPEPDQLEPNNGAAIASPLMPGGQILFNILPRTDSDWFRVEAPAGGELSIVIDETPENLDLYYRVWDANHQVVRDWIAPYRQGGATEGFADLPRPGPYFIEVTDGNNDARSVIPATLSTAFTPIADTSEPNNTFGQAASLKIGEPVQSNILPIGDADWYLLEAPAAGSFFVTADEVDPELDIAVRLWNAEATPGNWAVPPRKGGVTEAEFSVPAAGLYRLEVTDANNDARSRNPFRLLVEFR
jgi:uncharacterized caspase-like protein